MPRIAPPLSATAFRNLKPKEKPYEVADGWCPGLRVEVLPTGSKIWRLRYTLDGKREKLTIGQVSLAEAHRAAEAAREKVAAGESPAADKQTAKARSNDDEATVRGFYDHRFLPDHLSKLKSHKRVSQLFEREILPKLGALQLDKAGPDEIERTLDNIKARSVSTAILTRAWMGSFFELAVDRRRIDSNPVRKIKRKRVGPTSERTHVMTAEDLHAYVAALRSDAPAVQAKHRLCLEFILLTACRRGEAVTSRWADIDLDAGVWTVPAEHMKNDEEHAVYLSRRAIEILEAVREIGKGSEWVFPADRAPANALHPECLNVSLNRLVRDVDALKSVAHFTIHDGRRGFSTWAHENLEHPDVVESCLAHTIGGVRGIYARPQFVEARKKLMQAWADHCNPPNS